jgi:hypothetical protein
MAIMTHFGTSRAAVDILCGVFLLGVFGLRGTAFAGVLGLAGEEVGVENGSFVLEDRVLFRSLAGRALSRYLYNFWYTFGGHGGRGSILERFRVCFSLQS